MKCKWIIKHTAHEAGLRGWKEPCPKDAVKDGYCQYHYNKRKYKLTPWGLRSTYIACTPEIFNSGRSLKYKFSHVHHIFKMKDGVLCKYNNKTGRHEPTNLHPPDYNLFCYRKP